MDAQKTEQHNMCGHDHLSACAAARCSSRPDARGPHIATVVAPSCATWLELRDTKGSLMHRSARKRSAPNSSVSGPHATLSLACDKVCYDNYGNTIRIPTLSVSQEALRLLWRPAKSLSGQSFHCKYTALHYAPTCSRQQHFHALTCTHAHMTRVLSKRVVLKNTRGRDEGPGDAKSSQRRAPNASQTSLRRACSRRCRRLFAWSADQTNA